MMSDPILKEIRDIRHQIESNYQDDPHLLYEYLCRVQAQYPDRLIRRSPQPALKSGKSVA